MKVSLTPQLQKFIDERLKSGMYETASEVVREGRRAAADPGGATGRHP